MDLHQRTSMTTTPVRVDPAPKWWKVCWLYGDQQVYGRSRAISQPVQNKSECEASVQSGQSKPSIKPNLMKRETPQCHQQLTRSDSEEGFIPLQYSWVPPMLTGHQIRLYFSTLPTAKVPLVDSLGERYRVHQLLQQLPPQDSEARSTRTLSEEERSELRQICAQAKECGGRGEVVQLKSTFQCQSCEGRLSTGDMSVFASRAGPNRCWHPACFVCSVCQELLVDLIYFYRENKLYCGRHHAETLKPRCSACDELILTDERVEAEGGTWHMNHFACLQCDQQLGGQSYIMREGHTYCITCFDIMYAEYCDSCGEPIEVNQGEMNHRDQHWHATDKCFYCYNCKIPLLGRPFLPLSGHIYCSRSCSQKNASSVTIRRQMDEGMNQSSQINLNQLSPAVIQQHRQSSYTNSQFQNPYLMTLQKPNTFTQPNSSRGHNTSLFKKTNSVMPYDFHKEYDHSNNRCSESYSRDPMSKEDKPIPAYARFQTYSLDINNKTLSRFSKREPLNVTTKDSNYEVIDETFVNKLFESNVTGKCKNGNPSDSHSYGWSSKTNQERDSKQMYNIYGDRSVHEEVDKWLAEREQVLLSSSTSDQRQALSNLCRPEPPESPHDSGRASSIAGQQSPTPTLNYSESPMSTFPDLTLQSNFRQCSSNLQSTGDELVHVYAQVGDLIIEGNQTKEMFSETSQTDNSSTGNLKVEKWLSKGTDQNEYCGAHVNSKACETVRGNDHSFSAPPPHFPCPARSKKNLSVKFRIEPQQENNNLPNNTAIHHYDPTDSASTCSTCSTSSNSDDSTIYQIPHSNTRISYVPADISSITFKKTKVPPKHSTKSITYRRKCDIS